MKRTDYTIIAVSLAILIALLLFGCEAPESDAGAGIIGDSLERSAEIPAFTVEASRDTAKVGAEVTFSVTLPSYEADGVAYFDRSGHLRHLSEPNDRSVRDDLSEEHDFAWTASFSQPGIQDVPAAAFRGTEGLGEAAQDSVRWSDNFARVVIVETSEEPPPEPEGPHLMISRQPDRSNAKPLSGTIYGDDGGAVAFVFLAGAPDAGQVTFFLDGRPVQTEGAPPWDFGSGSEAEADPYTLPLGTHTIRAETAEAGTYSATFTVESSAPPGGDLPPPEPPPLPPPEAGAPVMPVEVFALAGTGLGYEAITVEATAPADTVYLVLSEAGYNKAAEAERRGYDQMASMRVRPEGAPGGGTWITLDNDQPMYYPERRTGGVWGIRQPVRMAVPIADEGQQIPAGEVTLSFRFNGTEGVSSGYRVLEIDLRSGSRRTAQGFGASVMETRFAQTRPSVWQAPQGFRTAEDAERGKWLFERTQIIHSPLVETVAQATCESCHMDGGYDLAYFNYSNKSIVSRSRFHGLTEEEGKEIAAYIRSIELNIPNGYTADDTGRPWNAPFQPGTKSFGPEEHRRPLSQNPEALWPAGAGYRAVLDHDQEMEPAMYAAWRRGEFGWHRHIEKHDIALALAFETWNGWLPDRHPFDTFGKDVWQRSEAYQNFQELRQALASTSVSRLLAQQGFNHNGIYGGLFGLINDFDLNVQRGRLPDDYQGYVRRQDYPFVAMHSIKQWQVVKQLGLEMQHGQTPGETLLGLGRETYYDRVPSGEHPDRWYSRDRMSLQRWRSVFEVAPHMNAKFKASWEGHPEARQGFRYASAYPSEEPFPGAFSRGVDGVHVGASCVWYAAQMEITDGGGVTGRQAPMDWKYNWTLCSGYGRLVGEDPYMYHTLSQVIEQQNALGSPYAFGFRSDRRGYGLDWPSIDPWWTAFYSGAAMPSSLDPSKNMAQMWEPKKWDPLLTALGVHEEQPDASSVEEDLIGYDRGEGRVEQRGYTPTLGGQVNAQTGLAHNIFNAMARYGEFGVDRHLAERIAEQFSQLFTGVPGGRNMTAEEWWMWAYNQGMP